MKWQDFYSKKKTTLVFEWKNAVGEVQELEYLIPIQPEVTTKLWDSEEKIISRNYVYLNYLKFIFVNVRLLF
ncbi:hypothetical protein CMU59_18440 [Elizabethkingia anophelis]|nr:hypothetical protein [Elizabethkingia anophelis]MDV3601517.1 hypothetical protein [Elizabethkingia anophelis]MDV3608576.1 hypothetical protein [Elizabethkingia anophelis]MDV3640622.1 hypothetical protein [Elizabethkingia anophelis]MDV3651470.1 hypothetical protein [Elizabethkingia anophelis]